MRSRLVGLVGALSVAVIVVMGRPLGAQEVAEDVPSFGIAGKVGIVFPQVATELQTTWGLELEASYLLPPMDRRIGVFLAAGYTQPEVSRTSLQDPRVGGSYDGTQTQKELTLGAGAVFRFLRPTSEWNAYVAAGLRVYFLQTVTVGSAGGSDFGENTEQSTHVGGVFALAGERRLGPGALVLEVQLGTSSLPHLITGDVSTGALAVAVGYRLFL
jgi:hypothetical protein